VCLCEGNEYACARPRTQSVYLIYLSHLSISSISSIYLWRRCRLSVEFYLEREQKAFWSISMYLRRRCCHELNLSEKCLRLPFYPPVFVCVRPAIHRSIRQRSGCGLSPGGFHTAGVSLGGVRTEVLPCPHFFLHSFSISILASACCSLSLGGVNTSPEALPHQQAYWPQSQGLLPLPEPPNPES
jgi:hypothetical protein